MTRILLFLAGLGLAAVVAPLVVLQGPISEEEYEAAMKEIRLTVSDVRGHVDARYWPELETEVGRLQTYFTQIEAFWTARGADGAVGFAQEALRALEGLLSASSDENQAVARDAVKTLQGTCGSCHTQYREETDDGYRIKP